MLLNTFDSSRKFLVEIFLARDVPPDRELREGADKLRGDLHSGQLGFWLQGTDDAMSRYSFPNHGLMTETSL